MPFDVFEEAPFWIDLFDDAADMGPQVPGVVLALSFACKAERLAWISGSEDMNLVAPSSAVEGRNIVPERSLIQGLVFHPSHESGRRECFPFDVTNSSIGGFCDVQSEFQSSNSCTE